MSLGNELLRSVVFRGFERYTLATFDTYRCNTQGKHRVRYIFYDNTKPVDLSKPLFSGYVDVGGFTSIDSDEVLLSIMTFVTLRKGDTDSDYFDNYTQDQIAFRESDICEELSCALAIARETGDNIIIDKDEF